MTKTKRCSRCHHTLPVDAFTRDAGTHDGYAAYCRPCRATTRTRRTPADQLTAAATAADRALKAHAQTRGMDIAVIRAIKELREAADRWRLRD